MIKYLDPKNDLTFRKIFGEKPHLLISFLNSVLPLEENQEIETITYLDSELLPELPGLKRSIVDVRCVDNSKRIFIVEMQMYWTSSFKSRMLFNASKAYVKQLQKGGKYTSLHPVYGLSLVNENYLTEKEFENQYYHHYRMVHTENSQEKIEGVELIFIELQKFKALKFADKRLRALWLRFLTEIDENTTETPKEFDSVANIKEALEIVQESAFTPEELEHYDKYWDSVSIERTVVDDLENAKILLEKNKIEIEKSNKEIEKSKIEVEKSKIEVEKSKIEVEKSKIEIKQIQQKAEQERQKAEQKDKQLEQERQKAEQERQKAEQERQKLIETVKNLKSLGVSIEIIEKSTGLSKEEIEKL